MNDNKVLSKQLLYLIVCAMQSKQAEKQKVEEMNLTELYQLAKFHSVTGMCAMVLERFWKEYPELRSDVWRGEAEKQLRRSMLLDMECQEVFKLLEKNHIWYMPLKGALLNELYPKYGMRQMCDCDIFYDENCKETVRELMEHRGYEKHKDVAIVDKYLKKPIYNFEFHRELVSIRNRVWYKYYRNFTDRLIQCENSPYSRRFSDEDFYIYLIVHANKHYETSGTGIRILPDCYVYLQAKKDSMDWQYITRECEKLGIDRFELKLRSLTETVFSSDGLVLTAEQETMLDFILSCGTYGTEQSRADNTSKRFGTGFLGKIRYIRSRVFPDMFFIQNNYPFFYKHCWALPALWIFRLMRLIVFRRDAVVNEVKKMKNQ